MPPKKPDEDDPNPITGTLKIPTGSIVPFLLGILGGGASHLGFMGHDAADTAALQEQVAELRSDVRALTTSIDEVRRVEEAAHPRVGVPPIPPAR